MRVFLIDTETTSAKPDRGLLEVGLVEVISLNPLKLDNSIVVQRFNPGKPSDLGALATHHIQDHEVQGCPTPDTFTLPDNTTYIIAHSAKFDFETLGSPSGIKLICTLVLARRTWPSLDSHKLGALIYFLDPTHAKDRLKDAHSTAGDIKMCATVLEHLAATMNINDVEELWRASEDARKISIMPLGQYKGKLLSEIKATDRQYLEWLLSPKCNFSMDSDLRKSIVEILKQSH